MRVSKQAQVLYVSFYPYNFAICIYISLDFDARLATESARRALVGGIRRLRQRVLDGAPLRLMCACLTPGRHVSCHANTIAIFLMDPLPREEPMSPHED